MFKDYLNSKVINTSATIRSSSFKLNHVAIKSVLIKAWVKGTCRIYNETFLKKRSTFEHYYSGLLIRCGSLLKISSVTGKFPRKLWKGGSPSLETETGTQTSRIPPQKKPPRFIIQLFGNFASESLLPGFSELTNLQLFLRYWQGKLCSLVSHTENERQCVNTGGFPLILPKSKI